MSNKKNKKRGKKRLSKWHYHEALDRCALVNDVFYDYIEQNSAVQENIGLKEKAEQITFDINDLYNDICIASDKKFSKKKKKK